MKTINKILLLSFLFWIPLSCGKNDPSADDIFVGKLSVKTWTISVASLDNQDVTAVFPNLKLNFTPAKTYTTTGAVPPVWKETGSFTISGTSPNYHLIRDEGIDVTVVESDTKLVLEFQYDKKLAGGKVNSVSGKYHFEFN
ncbi:hypothetical protein WSM22_25250 [Cytophagales bacterium WSM2-2]|nr:hypothetical protein WSM22_25250 [Cytophagales bacterium WSM2-2]